jgi:ABC-2 type transport system permease protein
MPQWMQFFASISPGTYVIQGMRAAMIDGAHIWSPAIWSNTWPLLITGIVSIPLGVYLFSIAEHYAKRTGRLKRNG